MNIEFDAAIARIVKYEQKEIPALAEITKSLTFKDKRITFANRNKPAFLRRSDNVCLFNTTKRTFPTGLLPKVYEIVSKYGFTAELNNLIPSVKVAQLELPDWIYDHQQEIIRTGLKQQRGIIKSPTGSGKTKAMAFLAKHYAKCKILITVPSKQLLHQTVDEIEQVLEEKVGKIGDSTKQWKRVTVGIINSLANLTKQVPDEFADVCILLIDECHRAASSYYVTVGDACKNTAVRLGFSATPWRETGDDLVMEGVIGPIILSISETVLQKTRLIMPVHYYTLEVPQPNLIYTGAIKEFSKSGKVYYSYDHLPNGKPERMEVVEKALVQNPERNSLIIEVAQAFLRSNYPYPAVILVERIEHGKHLQKLLQERGYTIEFICGTTPSKKRKQLIDELGQETRLIIASDILKEGVDIPQLGVAIIAGGGTASSKIIQQIGRICRRFKNKTKAIIIDLEDTEKYYLAYASYSRIEAVKKTYPGSVKSITVDCLDGIFCDQS